MLKRDPNVTVSCLFLKMSESKEPCYTTVFAVKDKRWQNGHECEFYANAYTSDEQATFDLLKVRGYDSWVEGTGVAATMASTDPKKADERLKMAFSGLPIFFSGLDTKDLADDANSVISAPKRKTSASTSDVSKRASKSRDLGRFMAAFGRCVAGA